jgi:uncharacterized protein (TIGR02246 family)
VAQNARDFTAFGQFFAEDAEFVNVSARYAKGRDEIVKLQAKMPQPVLTVRFLRPDIAIVHMEVAPGDCPPCAAAAAAMRQKPGKDSREVMSWVLSKHGGRWLIDAAQNTVWGLVPAH